MRLAFSELGGEGKVVKLHHIPFNIPGYSRTQYYTHGFSLIYLYFIYIYPGYGVFVCDNVVFSPGALVAHKVDP